MMHYFKQSLLDSRLQQHRLQHRLKLNVSQHMTYC